MHELTITEHLLKTALYHGEKARAKRITALTITVGELTSVVDDSVQFYWDIAAGGTMAEGAVLHFERIPCRLACEGCAAEFLLADFNGHCPECMGERLRVISGTGFQLESMEVEELEESYV